MFLKNVMFWDLVFLQIVFSSENNSPQFYVVSTTQKPPKLHEEPNPVKLEIYLNNLFDIKLESILQNQFEQKKIVNKIENYIDELRSEILILKNDYNQRKSLCEYDIQTHLQDNYTKTYLENSHNNFQKLMESMLQNQFKEHNNIVNEMKNQLETTRKEILIIKEHDSQYKKSLETEIQTNFTLYKQLFLRHSNDTKSYMENVNNKLAKLTLPKSCKEIQKRVNTVSGVYTIWPDFSPESFDVWCDMETRGGGWTYVINRFDGSVNFNLSWNDYRNGFGNLNGEFWLGLEHLHLLTKSKPNELLIELVDQNLTKAYAHYQEFSIGDEVEGYPIKAIKDYSGDAGDDFSGHLGCKFSTADRDQDTLEGNCAVIHGGGFWYAGCYSCLFTGSSKTNTKIRSLSFRGSEVELKKVKIMIR